MTNKQIRHLNLPNYKKALSNISNELKICQNLIQCGANDLLSCKTHCKNKQKKQINRHIDLKCMANFGSECFIHKPSFNLAKGK